ncbi:hypothetical protein [Blastopirellula retiformator]|uniref:Uncharacterized protein n=1 Tax=Blastopirellula retiformator TaxID=2527970 RepID=A0A5C5VIU4_9BACT|nr:hypothetical protein [Blastopirellula retiformator]TWT38564.1 hypothetical protein Enr8_02570 [Blastopirellula retiformator]
MRARSLIHSLLLQGLIVLLVIAGVSWYCWQSSEKVPVSPQTTYLIEPLLPNGHVNYALAVLERRKGDATPQNNAAIPFLQATWPCNMPAEQWSTICREMEFDVPTSPGLQMPYEPDQAPPFREWLAEQDEARQADDDSFPTRIRNLLLAAGDAPWTDDQFPPLAAWVEAETPHLDHVQQIEGKTSFYYPMILLVDYPREELTSIRTPANQALRTLSEALSIRAMYRLGKHEPKAAWRDVRLIYALSLLRPQLPSLIELNACYSIRERAIAVTHTLIASGQCDGPLLAEIERHVTATAPFDLVPTAVKEYERLVTLDASIRGATELGGNAVDFPTLDAAMMATRLNENFDRITEILEDPQRMKRRPALKQLEAEFSAATAPRTLVGNLVGAVQLSAAGKRAADSTTFVFLPSVMQVGIVESRTNTSLHLLRVAIQLEQYRDQTGDYPPQLCPAIESQLARDPQTQDALQYRLYPQGYLLYSLFENRTDELKRHLTGDAPAFDPPSERLPNQDVYLATPGPSFKSQLEKELRAMGPRLEEQTAGVRR